MMDSNLIEGDEIRIEETPIGCFLWNVIKPDKNYVLISSPDDAALIIESLTKMIVSLTKGNKE